MHAGNYEQSGIKIFVTGAATIVELEGAEYGSGAKRSLQCIDRTLTLLAREPEPLYLIVDLARVDFMGARLIGILASARSEIKRQRRRMALCDLTPQCLRLARVLHLETLFDIFESRQLALTVAAELSSVRCGAMPAKFLVRISDVAWDADKVRVEYLTESRSPVYTRIVPRDARGRPEHRNDRSYLSKQVPRVTGMAQHRQTFL